MISKKRTTFKWGILALVFVAVSVFSVVSSGFTPRAEALGGGQPAPRCGAPTYSWLNKATISSVGCSEKPGNTGTISSDNTFVDSVPTDSNHTFTAAGDCGTDTLAVSGDNKTAKATIHYTVITVKGNRITGAGQKTKCSASTSSIKLQNVQNAGKASTGSTKGNPQYGAFAGDTFAWVDKTHIKASGPVNLSFSGSADDATQLGSYKSGTYVVKGSGTPGAECPATITVNLATKGGSQSKGTLNAPGRSGRFGCDGAGTNAPITIGNTSKAPDLIPAPGAADAQTPTCESTGGALGWIFCPIINGIAATADGIYGHMIQPLLVTSPLSLSASDPTFQAWSEFRVLGDIFLVITLLIVVFGQSIGGGLIDAYSAKKILPRLLMAAVAINLSIYLVAFAVDATNVIGNGIQALIQQPFANAHANTLKIGGTTSTLGMTALVTGGIWAALSGLPLLGFLFTFLFVPILLTLIAILATVIIRRAAILFLILVSPVAFALYCLPNTEQYFKKWWDLLLKTLMVYPIIAGIFGIANVLSVTVGLTTSQDSSTVTKALSQIISLVALVIPLFLIPFAFKLAGGAIGTLHDTLTNGRKRAHEAYKGNPNDMNSRQNRARSRLADRNVRTRERGVSGVNKLQTGKAFGGRAKGLQKALGNRNFSPLGLAGRALNSGDLEYRRSELNKKENEKRELKTGFGPDSSVRALFSTRQADGTYKSDVNGAIYSAEQHAKAQQLHGRGAGMSATQAALNYELGKTGNDDEYNAFMNSVPARMQSMGYQDSEIKSVMKGVGYGAAAKRLEAKHTQYTNNGDGTWSRKVDRAAFAQDMAENYGSYPISNMKTSPIEELGASYDAAHSAIAGEASVRAAASQQGKSAEEVNKAVDEHYESAGFKGATGGRAAAERTIDDVVKTAHTLDSRLRSGGQGGEEEGVPVAGSAGGSGAAGRVNEAITGLVSKVNTREGAKEDARRTAQGLPTRAQEQAAQQAQRQAQRRGPAPPTPNPNAPPRKQR